MADPASVVRRYFEVVADLGSTDDDLLALLHPDVRITDRVVVRSTIGIDRERLRLGTELVAHIAAWLTVTDGLIREHETFDCYEPFGS